MNRRRLVSALTMGLLGLACLGLTPRPAAAAPDEIVTSYLTKSYVTAVGDNYRADDCQPSTKGVGGVCIVLPPRLRDLDVALVDQLGFPTGATWRFYDDSDGNDGKAFGADAMCGSAKRLKPAGSAATRLWVVTGVYNTGSDGTSACGRVSPGTTGQVTVTMRSFKASASAGAPDHRSAVSAAGRFALATPFAGHRRLTMRAF